jgi:H+-transporting ATPase
LGAELRQFHAQPRLIDPEVVRLRLAILAPARERALLDNAGARTDFHPFDPTTRRSEGLYTVDGQPWRGVKGAATIIGPLCHLDATQQIALDAAEEQLAASGARVLAVAAGASDTLQLLGVVGLSDPPRPDAADLIARIKQLGVRVCMATGDAEETARAIGAQLGLGTRVCHIQKEVALDPSQCDLYARVLPEDKHHIVAALRQAEMGIAVASATDVAKAAAGWCSPTPGWAACSPWCAPGGRCTGACSPTPSTRCCARWKSSSS